jgi:WD40 repeat protein
VLSEDHSRVEKALKSADSPVVAIAAHPDGSILAVCHSDGVIRIISMDSGMVIRNVPNLPVAPPDGDRSR